MQKVFDYAGNEIKEGSEVCCIRLLKKNSRGGMLIPETKEIKWFGEENPDEECFDKSNYVKVILYNGELGYNETVVHESTGEEWSLTDYVTSLNLWMPYEGIIAIKGLSDTKEKYDLWKDNKKLPDHASKKPEEKKK